MTVHPFQPADHDDRDRRGDSSCDDEESVRAGLGTVLDLLLDRSDEVDDRFAQVDRLIDGLDDSVDRFGSFEPSHVLAHRAVSPGLLSGLCWTDLAICQAFHVALFELLEDVGDFDGLIATEVCFVDTGTRRMAAANAWLHDHPAPPDGNDSSEARTAALDHSLALAESLGSNPSLTFASAAALREHLLDSLLEHGERDLVVSDEQVDWLTELAFRLLSELRHHVAIVGGAHVWAAEARDRS